LLLVAPLDAQELPITPDPMPSPRSESDRSPAGQLGKSLAGEVGRRQTAGGTESIATPMARINSRVPNRVQNRIRNRIDRYYDPKGNTTSPFEVAEAGARQAQPR